MGRTLSDREADLHREAYAHQVSRREAIRGPLPVPLAVPGLHPASGKAKGRPPGPPFRRLGSGGAPHHCQSKVRTSCTLTTPASRFCTTGESPAEPVRWVHARLPSTAQSALKSWRSAISTP